MDTNDEFFGQRNSFELLQMDTIFKQTKPKPAIVKDNKK